MQSRRELVQLLREQALDISSDDSERCITVRSVVVLFSRSSAQAMTPLISVLLSRPISQARMSAMGEGSDGRTLNSRVSRTAPKSALRSAAALSSPQKPAKRFYTTHERRCGKNGVQIIMTDKAVQGTCGARHGVRDFRHPVWIEKRQNAVVGGRPARRLLSDLGPQGGDIAADDERWELENADQKARRVRAPACPVL